MKSKLNLVILIIGLFFSQNSEAQFFKKLKDKVKAKTTKLENKVTNKLESKVEKKIENIFDKKETNSKKKQVKESSKQAKDFADVIIKHSKKFGSVGITEVSKVKVNRTNSGYNIQTSWWSHEADIYDGFILHIKTDENLKHITEQDKNKKRRTFKIPEEATLKLGYDPQLFYNKKGKGNFKKAVTDDYQNYNISKGEVTVDVLTDESIQISFSGKATLKQIIRSKNNYDDYTETFFESNITGAIDGISPDFTNEESIVKKETKSVTTWDDMVKEDAVVKQIPGVFNFNYEVAVKITIPDQDRDHKMSYLLNSKAKYFGVKVNMSDYSDESMGGESIIITNDNDVHIFVETAGMKMQMSQNMMKGKQAGNPSDKMKNYDYTKLQKTGKTKTILGAKCYEYIMSDADVKMNFWVAPSIQLTNWFVQNKHILNGFIMEYTVNSKEGIMKSEVVAIKDNISKTINSKEYRKMF